MISNASIKLCCEALRIVHACCFLYGSCAFTAQQEIKSTLYEYAYYITVIGDLEYTCIEILTNLRLLLLLVKSNKLPVGPILYGRMKSQKLRKND